MLSDVEIDFIKAEIDASEISIESLKEDLLDHICCFVENEMRKGSSFETAYTRAMEQICPNGFNEIQNETIYLLNHEKIKMMKKVMYASGLIFTILLCTGLLFKLMHLMGAEIIFNIGFLGLILVFLPLGVIERYKLSVHTVLSEKMKFVLGGVSISLIALGFLLKLNHLPFGNILFVTGAILFILGFLPFLFFRLYKKSVE